LFTALFDEGSLVYHLFALGRFGQIDLAAVAESSPTIRDEVLAKAIVVSARMWGHEIVNEVHVLWTLIELFPGAFGLQFELLCAIRHDRPPDPRIVAAIEKLEASGKVEMGSKLRRALRSGQLDKEHILDGLRAYVSSPYFPYGHKQWELYKTSLVRPKGPRDKTHLAFGAHLIVEASKF
jgi:hypothetical protein